MRQVARCWDASVDGEMLCAPSAPPPSPVIFEIPFTGMEVTKLGLIATLLVLAGVALVWWARRKLLAGGPV